MKLKFICENENHLKYIFNRYSDFFNDDLESTMINNLRKGYKIFLFDNFNTISWCFEDHRYCTGCALNNDCKEYYIIDINRILKMNRINKTN